MPKGEEAMEVLSGTLAGSDGTLLSPDSDSRSHEILEDDGTPFRLLGGRTMFLLRKTLSQCLLWKSYEAVISCFFCVLPVWNIISIIKCFSFFSHIEIVLFTYCVKFDTWIENTWFFLRCCINCGANWLKTERAKMSYITVCEN